MLLECRSELSDDAGGMHLCSAEEKEDEMDQQTLPDAWVKLATEAEIRARIPADAPRHPYDFGFLAPMSRLTQAHSEIGSKFSALFAQIMFAPGALTRQEREMIAGVAAAAQDCYY